MVEGVEPTAEDPELGELMKQAGVVDLVTVSTRVVGAMGTCRGVPLQRGRRCSRRPEGDHHQGDAEFA